MWRRERTRLLGLSAGVVDAGEAEDMAKDNHYYGKGILRCGCGETPAQSCSLLNLADGRRGRRTFWRRQTIRVARYSILNKRRVRDGCVILRTFSGQWYRQFV